MFGRTAAEWKKENPELSGNMRDYATIEELIVMVNLENMNANFIENGLKQDQRLIELNKIARSQLNSLLNSKSVKSLGEMKSDGIEG